MNDSRAPLAQPAAAMRSRGCRTVSEFVAVLASHESFREAGAAFYLQGIGTAVFVTSPTFPSTCARARHTGAGLANYGPIPAH
eukprot:scaffold167381_cov32-Tisochrysis_lutea.AAC.4